MADAVLVVLGAVLGLTGSLVGSAVSARAALRRERRLHIHDELLPPLRAAVVEFETGQTTTEPTNTALTELKRAAVVLPPRERRLIEELRARVDEHHAAVAKAFGVPSDSRRPLREVRNDFDMKYAAVETSLVNRLRGRWPPW